MSFTVKLTLIDGLETLNTLSTSVRVENEQFFSREPDTNQEKSPTRLISEKIMKYDEINYSLQYSIGPLTKLNTLENTIIDLLEHLQLSIEVFSEFTKSKK